MKAAVWPAVLASALVFVLAPRPAHAQSVLLRVTLQPDCFRPTLGSACDKRKTGERLDLGPQIAMWVESADGARFVDTVLVTNLTALLGIGNRPGHATLPSGPKFPYGRRPQVLPVWAHRRGKLYQSLVMQDGLDREYWLGFHEISSSPDPYFCRPMRLDEIDVDAVTCPTQRFNSVKGRFFDETRDQINEPYVPPAKSYYPPRNDLTTFTLNDCDSEQNHSTSCPVSAKQFAALNDLDLVAAATPPYGRPTTTIWRVPDALPEGDYALFVEINKEFDQNQHHAYPARRDPMLAEWGQLNNVGQPSIVFRVPFRLSRSQPVGAATSAIAGYGDPAGKTGQLRAPDNTISDAPGSGLGRLLVISQPPSPGAAPLSGRVIVGTQIGGSTTPPPTDAGVVDAGADAGGDAAAADALDPGPPRPCALAMAPPLSIDVADDEVAAETATVSFVEPLEPIWSTILQYKVRRWAGEEMSESRFMSGIALDNVAKSAPGARVTVSVPNLRSETWYTVGVQPSGDCGTGPVGYRPFLTKKREFTMLSGCFIATAAYGTPLGRDVALLRRVRDRAAAGHGLAAAAADVYGRASPPLADVLRGSEAARAVARGVLRPLVELARALD